MWVSYSCRKHTKLPAQIKKQKTEKLENLALHKTPHFHCRDHYNQSAPGFIKIHTLPAQVHGVIKYPAQSIDPEKGLICGFVLLNDPLQ